MSKPVELETSYVSDGRCRERVGGSVCCQTLKLSYCRQPPFPRMTQVKHIARIVKLPF